MNFCFDVNYLCVPSEFVGFTFQYNGAKDRSDCIMEKNIYNALIVTPRSAYSINSI